MRAENEARWGKKEWDAWMSKCLMRWRRGFSVVVGNGVRQLRMDIRTADGSMLKLDLAKGAFVGVKRWEKR